MLLKYFICSIFLFNACLFTNLLADDREITQDSALGINTRFYRVYFDDPDIARDIVISMNTVESRYEDGFIIVEIWSDEEYDRLIATGLEMDEIDDPVADKTASIRHAAEFAAAGIPAFPCYRTVEETFTTAETIVTTYPGFARWIDTGDSWEKSMGYGGYDMNVLILTNSAVPGPKPKMFVTGAIHAREYATAELVTRFAEYLVNNYGSDADATWLLDYHELHVMLHANPDGRKQAELGLSWRKNTNENYCFYPYNRGADLNRNFEFKWGCCGGSSGDECNETYRGPSPASEPETQAITAYILSTFPDQRGPDDTDAAPPRTTGLYIDMHSHGRLLLWPWSWTSAPAPNSTELQTIGRKLAYFDNHSPEQAYGLYPIDGDTITFAYGELGIPSFIIELGRSFFENCSYFESDILPGNMLTLLYAFKIVRTPYLTAPGPDSTNLLLDRGSTPSTGVPAGTIVTLRAVIDDTHFNNSHGWEPTQNIAGAEYYVDTPPWITSPPPVAYPMSPVDSSFDSNIETVEATIDTTDWSQGQHIIFVRGWDLGVSWGAFSAIFLYINGTINLDEWKLVCICMILLSFPVICGLRNR